MLTNVQANIFFHYGEEMNRSGTFAIKKQWTGLSELLNRECERIERFQVHAYLEFIGTFSSTFSRCLFGVSSFNLLFTFFACIFQRWNFKFEDLIQQTVLPREPCFYSSVLKFWIRYLNLSGNLLRFFPKIADLPSLHPHPLKSLAWSPMTKKTKNCTHSAWIMCQNTFGKYLRQFVGFNDASDTCFVVSMFCVERSLVLCGSLGLMWFIWLCFAFSFFYISTMKPFNGKMKQGKYIEEWRRHAEKCRSRDWNLLTKKKK